MTSEEPTLYQQTQGTMPHERWPVMEAVQRGVLVPVESVGTLTVTDGRVVGDPCLTHLATWPRDLPPGTYDIYPRVEGSNDG